MLKRVAGIDYTGICTSFYCTDGNGNFVLHKRSNQCRDEVGTWDCGGGQLEFGLSIEQNIHKEILEEYGCSGAILQMLPSFTLMREHQGRLSHWLFVPAIVKVNRSEVRINEPHKMAELGWFTLDSLPGPLHPAFSYTLEHYGSYFEKYRTHRELVKNSADWGLPKGWPVRQ